MSFELYPAIDLRGGQVVRLHQGAFDQETVYGTDPVAVAKGFADAGAPWIHVVDLDAARRQGSNRELVAAVAAAVEVPVQTGGGIRDDSVLASTDVARVVVGSAAVEDPAVVHDLAARFPGRVAVGLDHWDGEVKTRGWEEGSGRKLLDVIEELSIPGVAAFVITDISRDGALVGPDLDGYRAAVAATTVPIIASGGVGTLDHLRALPDTGATGVIVGKALYEGRFTVEEALALFR